MSEAKDEKSCSTHGCGCCCCCGKKALMGVLLAILLFGLGYCLGKGSLCHSMGGAKFCPFTQSQMQPMQQK